MTRSLAFFQVDAFSSQAFGGNPAAVILLPHGQELDDTTRQQIAAENNLAETAFIQPSGPSSALHGDGSNSATTDDDLFRSSSSFNLRWFTPTTEVPLCGHATLAAAAVLIKERGNRSDVLHFHTLSGVLEVTQGLEMTLPLAAPTDPVPKAVQGGSCVLAMTCTGGIKVIDVRYAASSGLKYILLCLETGTTREQLESVRPDMAALEALVSPEDVRGVILTTKGEAVSPYDFLSRFFAPWMGIPEDHVTGSAHSVLGPYWRDKLAVDEGSKPDLVMKARQCSPRGGDLTVWVDAPKGKVVISGDATVVIRGIIQI